MKRALIFIAHLFDGYYYKDEIYTWQYYFDYRRELLSIQKALGWSFVDELEIGEQVSIMFQKRKFTKARKMCRFLNFGIKSIDFKLIAFSVMMIIYLIIVAIAVGYL